MNEDMPEVFSIDGFLWSAFNAQLRRVFRTSEKSFISWCGSAGKNIRVFEQ
jgi:hypothetical protein